MNNLLYKADDHDEEYKFCVFVCDSKNKYLGILKSGFNFLSEAQQCADELNEELNEELK